jgi:BlaI family transcriptional regulator, penicillinase repressor
MEGLVKLMKFRKELSPVEVKVMNKLCELGEADIATVQQCFVGEKDWKYTTVLTIFQRLYHKKYIKRKKDGRKYIYRPVITRAALFKMFLKKFFGKAIEKDPTPLMDFLFEIRNFSEKDQKKFRSILESEKE